MNATHRFTHAALCGLAALLVAPTAGAKIPSKSLYIGVYGGGNIVTGDWDLREDINEPASPTSSGLVGAHIGGQLAPWLALEAALGLLPLKSTEDESNVALNYNVDALFHLTEGMWVPFIDVGLGAYQNLSGDLGADTDYQLHWGIGLRHMFTEWMAARAEARHVLTDTQDGESPTNSNIELRLGLDFFPVRETPDRDKDLIADAFDRCPDVAGVSSAEGCPDQDGDGLADDGDRCPAEAGPTELTGCPDGDRDGVVDIDDRCPKLAGAADTGGCPDQDRDGVLDAADRCPDKPGPAPLAGCPDSDKDGLADLDDRCPQGAGPQKHKGCPDRDNDSIPDIDDRCPEIQGIPQEQGCLPQEVAERFSGSIKGIYFPSNSAKILPKSFPVLTEAVAAMQRYQTLRIQVEGHTDDTGADDANQKLSEQRAESVRQYLVEKGIAAERVTSVGYGETRPVGDNKTKEGRAQNRRIEFTITTQ